MLANFSFASPML